MAGLSEILKALARAVWRDIRSLQSITGNNFMLFVLLVMYQQPQSILFFALIIGILLLGPLSADPLRKIPPDRLAIWPLTPGNRLILRLVSPALTPIVWIALPFFFMAAGVSFALMLIAIAALMQLGLGLWSQVRAGRPSRTAVRFIPRLPGMLGGLIQKDLRQLLSVLDPYVALVLAAGATAYRLLGTRPDPDAFLILGIVVVIALSTYAQCLFGLDIPSGVVRYRIFPLRGYQILLAKDIAFLLVLMALVAPLAPLPGLAAGLVALAVGHHASIHRPIAQTRWRFTAGVLFPYGFFQVAPMVATGVAVERASPWYLALALAAYLCSLWYFGRRWSTV